MLATTIRQLEYFVATAEAGTVSGGAERSSASQAAVSTALRELEKSLAVQLFVRRTAKGVTLTPSGSRVLGVARRILGDVAELEELARSEHDEVAGPLRIACTSALSPRVLPVLAAACAQTYPRVTLELTDGLAAGVQGLVLRGEADACLLYRRQLDPELAGRTIHTIQPYIVVAADHRLAGRDSASLRELADEPLILVHSAGSRRAIETVIAEAGVTTRQGWSFANPETVRAMVARGLGYSVFSGRPTSTETFDGGRVAYLRIDDEVSANEIVLALPRGQQPTARLLAVEKLLSTDELRSSFG
ncbi:LysR family transcriptional regulator [Microbacterium horticulturae]|uniref:LysR family transcriptional regulator n=1 Tax=Microbacterium horticulturae TaxID=3028316 RepID=A0ABY8C224_9MICO|nr:LysR family transcriptional regulator [Microbacterium sp. KACC 23027]WEG09782.1 LysR family transcriptional regulator [Microbacterium sp. KACC 23027]